MGAIKSFIEGLDSSKPEYNEQKELIEALAQLAEAKADSFALQIEKNIAEADSQFNKSLPVESWIDTTKETHAISSDSVDIVKKLTDGIKKFVKPDDKDKATNIIDGVGDMLGTAVEAFLGAGRASDEKLERMVVYLSGFGVERLDFKVWKREITGSGIKTKVSKVTAFVAVRSAVDLSKIKLNTFLILYGKQLTAMGYNESKLEEAIDTAKRILGKFKMGEDHAANTLDLAKSSRLITGK
ncbi:MAG: hypothetical protein Q8M93_16110 [Polaromonas sp.]|uniref:hypothetical protein n=1 Tax=Polaromonas sp. TaxID=1869339 RepID=UPI00273064E9|nr:hypothetical protein [Polaromonas sp.]MDP2450966.1 hypothetical protein [Polaromonas sp.]MDP3248474.1 hypothetical protein [Polaromonas sp.]MDP3757442.1 hypothetical protein [Polaromonas sp.]